MSYRQILATSAFALLLAACGGGGKQDSPDTLEAGQPSTAARTSVLAANDPDCPNGGILVETGIDSNGNGVLDAGEVDSAQKVCNGANGEAGAAGPAGANGLNALVRQSTEAQGANCPFGGVRFEVGIDANADGVLDSGEITSTQYICNDTAPRYAVGGSLGSYRGDGLMLVETVSGQVFYAAQGSTDYAFSLEDGAQYNIIIGAQPESPTEICDIRNGSGTVTGAAVADVAVTCAPGFTVGGGVYGLNSVGLMLQNNGADDLDVVGHGFEFATPLIDGSAYDVRISRQPETQDCSISNGSGTLAGADVTSVKVTCRNWRGATQIGTDNGRSITRPKIAFDGSGNAVAVWRVSDGTRDNIWANRYTAGSGWGTAMLIESDNSGNAFDPQIAMDTSGNALAVWFQYDGARYNIWANRYTAGSGWGPATLIESNNSGNASAPQIAFDASGTALAVWQQHDGTRWNIWANRYTTGSGWGTATLIETDNAGSAVAPQIAFDESGNALAVWYQFDGIRNNIWANRYTAGSDWGTATLIESDNSGNAGAPQIAIDASGNALAVWSQSDGTRNNIWANRYTAGSGWGTAALIESDAGNASNPQIAFDASGNALAVWHQSGGTRNNIWANRYTAGSGWGTAMLIESDDAGNASNPQIAFDASGNALAVWYQFDGTRNNIWANRYTAGSGWGAATLIESVNTEDKKFPQISIDASGNALAVWSQSDGTRTNIWANRYE